MNMNIKQNVVRARRLAGMMSYTSKFAERGKNMEEGPQENIEAVADAVMRRHMERHMQRVAERNGHAKD